MMMYDVRGVVVLISTDIVNLIVTACDSICVVRPLGDERHSECIRLEDEWFEVSCDGYGRQ
jgi:hypothetical protein